MPINQKKTVDVTNHTTTKLKESLLKTDMSSDLKVPKTEVVKEVTFETRKFNVFDLNYQVVETISLNEQIWNVKSNRQVIYDVIVSQQASRRQGTKKTKTRGLVRGGGKKPWRQKGTGRARHGSIRSPIWVGGGVTFGPTGNENYQRKVNKKVFKIAMKMILSDVLNNDKLIFWKDTDFKTPKTNDFLKILKKFKITNKDKVLLLVNDTQINLLFSARNIKQIKATQYTDLNPYDLVNADKILMIDEALSLITDRFQS